MGAARRLILRPTAWAITAVAALVVAIAVVAAWHPWAAPPATVAAGAGEAVVAAPPPPLDLPEHPVVLIFGDSWTHGQAAAVPTLGYAHVVAGLTGWTTVVDGVRGSGYLRPGRDGPEFGARIALLDPGLAPDLVIVQGSINDRALPSDGYREAVDAAWSALAETYPDAAIVILGPAPHELPAAEGTVRIDADLAELAAARGWWYVSPLAENWITDANYLDVIDVSDGGRLHPSTAGHRYLAERLAAAIAAVSR